MSLTIHTSISAAVYENEDLPQRDERRKALLGVRGLRVRRGEGALFDIERLDIATHGAYALTGVSGAGKSTLLRVLGGLEWAEIDSLRFEGDDVLRLHPYPGELRQAIVYVHPHPVMFSTSVVDNIGYGLRVRGVGRAQAAQAVEEALDWAGVAHLRGRDPARLSDGERQRVALARAKVLQPKLLLVDEPTAHLDDRARLRMLELIPALVDAGSSIVIACHKRDLPALPGAQWLELRDGRLEAH